MSHTELHEWGDTIAEKLVHEKDDLTTDDVNKSLTGDEDEKNKQFMMDLSLIHI